MEQISKTQKKREALSLQDFGEKLVKLPEEQLRKIELPEDVLKAVSLAKTITKRGALKRQMQYIGVLMRKIDMALIQEAVQNLEKGNRRQVELHKQAEHRRDELINGNDALLEELAKALPEAEQEHLKDIVTKARAEQVKPKPSPTPSRMLFRYLYNLGEKRR